MQNNSVLSGFLLSAIIVAAGIAGWDDDEVVRGAYFGQPLPGTVPELFAPHLFDADQGYHSSPVFSPDLSEAIWSPMENEHRLMYTRMTGGIWSTPRELNFGFDRGAGDATFSVDGSMIFFLSFQLPRPDMGERERIWYTMREGKSWSAPILIDEVICVHPTHWTFSLANNRNLYFTSEMEGVKGEQDIYVARFDGKKYLPPEDVGNAVNSGGKDLTPFVSPDEQYLIFSRIGADTRKADLYISYKDPHGNWSKAINLGEGINSEHHDLCPVVTPDGKYLFFISQREGKSRIYWVRVSLRDPEPGSE